MSRYRRGRLIAFSGVDGAGKSTQIKLLVEQLKDAGHQPRYLWSRGGYTPGFNMLKTVLRRLSRERLVPTSGPSAQRTEAFRQPWKRRLWLSLALLDLLWLYGFAIRIWCWSGRDVICDRYWQDTLIDFRLNFPQEQVERWLLWRLLLWLSPQPDAAFLLLVPVEESIRRSQQKDEPYPDTPETLIRRLKHYRAIAQDGHWQQLDGRLPASQLATMIRTQLNCGGQAQLAPEA